MKQTVVQSGEQNAVHESLMKGHEHGIRKTFCATRIMDLTGRGDG